MSKSIKQKKSMRIHHKKNNKKTFVVGLITVLLLIALGYAFFAYNKSLWPFTSGSPPQSTPATKAEQTQQEQKEAASQKTNYLNSQKQSAEQAQPAPVPTDSSSITLEAGQDRDIVVVTTKLLGSGYSTGTCTLTVTANSKSNTQTADIIYQPEYSTCAGFSIPTSQLGAGTWNISLSVKPLNASELTKTITQEVK